MGSSIHGFKVANGETRFGKQYKMKAVTLNALDLKVSSKDTNGAQSVFVQTGFSPNGGPPLHIHYNQDEIFYILEGEYQFQVGEERFSMKQGDTIFLPKNIPHAFIQLTDTAKVIVSFQPAGKMEDFFRVTNEWTTPPTKEEVAKAFEDHEMKIVGLPLKRL